MSERELDHQIFTLCYEQPKKTYLTRKNEDVTPKKVILNQSQFNLLCAVHPIQGPEHMLTTPQIIQFFGNLKNLMLCQSDP